jgi:thiol-disulfide isomerase/thioredoxin
MKYAVVLVAACLVLTMGARVAPPSWACAMSDQAKMTASSLRAPVMDFHAVNSTANATAQQVLAVDAASLAALQAQQPGDVLVAFYAPWCGHCKTFVLYDNHGNPDNAPIENLNRELIAANGPKVVKYDTQAHPVPTGYQVEYIPTVVLTKKNGQKLYYKEEPNDIQALKAWALANQTPVAPAQPVALMKAGSKVQSCIDLQKEDLQHRMHVQNKLADLCETMCKEVGAYPKCSACPSFVAPDATPGVMTWNELLPHMDNLAAWGKDQLKGWKKQASK